MSRHQKRLRHQHCIRSGRDINLQRNHGLDISNEEQWSRHPLQRIQGRDISQLSQHQLRRLEVATSFSGRDISNEEQWSRHPSEVATSVATKLRSRHHPVVTTSEASKEGCDVSQLSRHPLHRPEGRDIIK